MFAQRFEALCKEKKETPSAIGSLLGFSRGTVSKWRSGKCAPRGASLQRIADYFDVSVDYLIGKSDIRNADAALKDSDKAKIFLFGTKEVPEKAWNDLLKAAEMVKKKYRLS